MGLDQYVSVFEGEHWQCSQIKDVLETYEITVYLENEHLSSIASWYVTPCGINPVKVMVHTEDYKKSIMLITEFNNYIPDEE